MKIADVISVVYLDFLILSIRSFLNFLGRKKNTNMGQMIKYGARGPRAEVYLSPILNIKTSASASKTPNHST